MDYDLGLNFELNQKAVNAQLMQFLKENRSFNKDLKRSGFLSDNKFETTWDLLQLKDGGFVVGIMRFIGNNDVPTQHLFFGGEIVQVIAPLQVDGVPNFGHPTKIIIKNVKGFDKIDLISAKKNFTRLPDGTVEINLGYVDSIYLKSKPLIPLPKNVQESIGLIENEKKSFIADTLEERTTKFLSKVKNHQKDLVDLDQILRDQNYRLREIEVQDLVEGKFDMSQFYGKPVIITALNHQNHIFEVVSGVVKKIGTIHNRHYWSPTILTLNLIFENLKTAQLAFENLQLQYKIHIVEPLP